MKLLSPLPATAKVTRRPVAPPEVMSGSHGATLAGMEQLFAEVSQDGSLRIALAVVQGGVVIAVNDTITSHREERVRAGTEMVFASTTESVGGSVARDGTIRGTRWISHVVDDPEASPEEPSTESTPSPLSDEDAAALRALGAELLRRAPE